MASTTWYIQGIDTDGRDLVLSQIQPWSASGEETPLSITSTFPPTSGALSDLLIADNTECVFAAADVQKPGFAIVFTFNTAVDLWGFRFAGPSPTTWPLRHTIATGAQAATLPRVPWVVGALSPAPTQHLVFAQDTDEWFAQTEPGARSWYGCAVSGDGQVLLAVSYSSSNPWLSKDGGVTWAAQTEPGARSWRCCAVSGDGQVLLAGSRNSNLWLSKDGGTTWVAQTAVGNNNWYGCAVSGDGQVLLAGSSNHNPWLSKDGGVTWVEQTAPGFINTNSCAVSGDGQVLLAGSSNSNLWLSKDGGTTWVAQTAPGLRSWLCCAASADGRVLLAGSYSSNNLWLSKDGGTTWVAQTSAGNRNWTGCAVSGDGQVLLASAESNGNLWLSKDGGATWAEQTAPGARPWYGCAVSGDGHVLLAGSYSSANLWLRIESDPIYLPNTPRTQLSAPLLTVQGRPPDAQGTLNTYAAEAVQFNDFEFSGNGRVYGTVERKNTPTNIPLRRRVRLHRSRDGMLVRETWSKPDGSYEFKHVSLHYEYDAIAWDHEMSYRSVIANNLKPEAM